MNISQYLTIANTTGIDANARIDLNTEGGVSAVGTNMVGRLGERIVRKATDEQHYTQIRQNFLDSLMKLYGVEDQSGLPKMVLDAFKDEEVICGKPLTKRRVTAVLDAVRRHLDYSSLFALEHGVAEHVRAVKEAAKKQTDDSDFALKEDGRFSLYPDSGSEENVVEENPADDSAEKAEKNPADDFEIIDHEEDLNGPTLQERIQGKARQINQEARDCFASNISGKFVGAAADRLMARFDTFMKVYTACIAQDAGSGTSNYAVDWLNKMYNALTTLRKGNDDFAHKHVVHPFGNAPSVFMDVEKFNKDNDIKPDVYTFDEAVEILQKWNILEKHLPDMPNGSSFDLEDQERPVFNMDVALSFKDSKLTKLVLAGAKRFEARLRADAKNYGITGKASVEAYVARGMEIYKGQGISNKMRGELWSVDHQRLENPANDAEFEKEMRNIRGSLVMAANHPEPKVEAKDNDDDNVVHVY